MKRVQELLSKTSTPSLFAMNEFELCGKKGCIVASVNLCDSIYILEVLRGLKLSRLKKPTYDTVKLGVLQNLETLTVASEEEEMSKLLGGDALLFLDGEEGCLALATRKYVTRTVSEPPTSGIVKGPREGFIEDMRTNLSLIQRKLRTPDLKVVKLTVGRRTATNVSVVYLDGVAKQEIADSVCERLRAIDIDGIIDTHYVQEFLDERPHSIFPQSGVSEKPDIVAAKILEGRVAVLVDGSPMVATVPYLLLEELHSGEDYYERATYTSAVRIVRLLAVLLGIILPGLFIALEEFHVDILPQKMMLTLLNATNGLPLPPFGEVLFVIFIFEIIREAGVRMPSAMGLAMSIVGALVLGETAVQAGFMGPPAVVIVALSSISLYTVPGAVGTNSLLRIIFTVVGGIAGLYGMLIAVMILIIYLCCLDNYGSPYLAPYAPRIAGDIKDGLLKQPLTKMTERPKSIPNDNNRRMGDHGQNKL